MSNDKKRHVIPGEVIVTGSYRAEQNTVLVGDKILATVIGLSDVQEGSVRVIPLTGGYFPKGDDLVIGKITSHSNVCPNPFSGNVLLGVEDSKDPVIYPIDCGIELVC